jgi:predicted enzyme related to lactoylglutathione lyase
VIHLELHTGDVPEARELYAELCGWRTDEVTSAGATYHALELGDIGGGIVGCATERPVWIPYVVVQEIGEITDRARELGATVLLEPREGAKGWRSVVSTVQGGEIAFWQPKNRWRR